MSENFFNSFDIAFDKKDTNGNSTFDTSFSYTLYEIESWLTIILSSLSSFSILIISFMYLIAHVKSRDHNKESRKTAVRKVIINEYLVLSYCLSLFASHLITVLHKIISKFFLNGMENIDLLCLIIGIIKHYLWLSSLFHSNAVSIKIYLKLSKSLNGNLVDKKNWLKSATKIFFYIYGATFVIIVCSSSIHFGINDANVYELSHFDRINSCFLSQPLYYR